MHSRASTGLIELTTLPTEAEAGILQSVLTDAGIESWTQKAAGLDYLGLGTLGFSRTTITVRAEDADRARAALDANRQDSVDIDWSEVNVGEPEDEAAASIAAGPERAHSRAGIPSSSWMPAAVLLLLVGGLIDVSALILLLPVVLIGLVLRARWKRRSASNGHAPRRP